MLGAMIAWLLQNLATYGLRSNSSELIALLGSAFAGLLGWFLGQSALAS